MSAYEALAASYDRLTADVDYIQVLDFLEMLLQAEGRSVHSVLDMACGTGSLSVLLAQRGYEVIGADRSEDMLCVAVEKAMEMEANAPFFVHQSMQELALPQPVDCVMCCLDSINYLTDPQDCRETFSRVYENLASGGVFLFDVNTPEKLRALDGQVFLDEDDDVYCVWRAEFDETEHICYYGMDLFQRHGKVWSRSFEEHCEYAYEIPQLQRFLQQVGFTDIRVYADRRMTDPAPGEQRVYFSAYKR